MKKQKPERFRSIPAAVWRREWVSFVKHYGHGNDAVLNYLSRYVFRTAISNARILAVDQAHVTFRYADDFVVLCRSEDEAKEALALIEPLLHDRLGLTLSPEKTTITKFRDGFAFLGFEITSWSVKMRAKSVENFKTKVRQITRRSHNLDANVIEKLNRVIRGTANYFATPWSNCGDMYRSLDRWIRMRLRSMKFKRKSKVDNTRLRLKHFRNMGLLCLTDLRTSGVT